LRQATPGSPLIQLEGRNQQCSLRILHQRHSVNSPVVDTLPDRDGDPDEAENLSYRAIGPAPGNHKEIHNHYGNGGSQKIVWAWAGTATALFIAAAWLYVASEASADAQQAETNRGVAAAITAQSVSIAELKVTVSAMQRTVDRIETAVDQR
jgi:hypothetical protein